MSNYSYKTIAAIKLALSRPRISTFEAAVNIRDNNDPAAIKLYIWNALLSGALLTPLHICEVVIRNAVADALEKHFGPRWPWSVAFERNLPDPVHGYSARKALCYARRTGHSAEKIIPELNFVFWQNMFTRRYDANIWQTSLYHILPNLDHATSPEDHRLEIYCKLEQLRKLRNRIAHHEPVFSRNLNKDYDNIIKLIKWRCNETALWVHQHQTVITVLTHKPDALR